MALIAVLEATEAPGRSVNGDRRQLVCVGNTHVHSNPELTDVKLWQVRVSCFCHLYGDLLVSSGFPRFNSRWAHAERRLQFDYSVPNQVWATLSRSCGAS